MKTSSKFLLQQAREKHFAIPHVNFIDLESARVYVKTAQKRRLPIILAYAQVHSDILSLEEAALIGNFFSEVVDVPVVLHLDHGEDVAFIKKAIDLGFNSVMIDASRDPFEENILKTSEVVKYAKEHGVVVEAELGHVGANSSTESRHTSDSIYTDVESVVEFVKRTGVDSLAVSIGTAHGLYKGVPKINFERLHQIADQVDIPLVLHGGSSSGDDNLRRCAQEGISKINIYTDFITQAFQAIQSQELSDYIDLKEVASTAMEKVLEHYFEVFGTKEVDVEV